MGVLEDLGEEFWVVVLVHELVVAICGLGLESGDASQD